MCLKFRLWASVWLMALFLLGCGDDGGEVDAEGVPAGGTATTAVSVAPSVTDTGTDPVKLSKAKAAVLQPSDFPPGWTTQPEDAGLNIETVWQDLLRCLAAPASGSPAARALSPTFVIAPATQARSTVEYTTESSATAAAAALAGPASQRCATDAFHADVERSKPEGSTAAAVEVTPRDYAHFGDKTLAWRINGTVNMAGLAVRLVQDFIVVFKGDTVVRLFFLNTGGEFPQNLQQTLVERVVGRA